MSRKTWLDVIPVLPLAYSVPVISADGANRGVWTDNPELPVYMRGGGWWGADEGLWRVDLEDLQGFGYALQWLLRRQPHVWSPDERAGARLLWTNSFPANADLLALARACAEVVR